MPSLSAHLFTPHARPGPNTEHENQVRKAFRLRAATLAKGGGGTPELDKNTFRALVRDVGMLKFDSDVAGGVNRADLMPKDKDLDVAFIIADEDKSGGIDIDEFLNLYKLLKQGAFRGLGSQGGDKRANQEKKRLFRVQLEKTREAEQHIAVGLAASAAARAAEEEVLGNRFKTAEQIAAERELAIKVGRLMTMALKELRRCMLEEGFMFAETTGKTPDECRIMLSTKWTEQVSGDATYQPTIFTTTTTTTTSTTTTSTTSTTTSTTTPPSLATQICV